MSELARIHARELLRALRLEGPFDIRSAAERLGLDVSECDVSGFDGALVRVVGVPLGTILVKQTMRETGRKNFTIAHEIGHFVMPHHGSVGAVCRSEEVESWSKSLADEEREANVFAGEFLIPESFVKNRVCQTAPSFDSIRWMADTFSASFTASGYRLMDLTTFRAAIVWSTDGHIRWFKPSGEFRGFVPVHERIQEGTLAYNCFQGQRAPDSYERVPADLWLRVGRIQPDATVLEHSVFLPNYRSVLTLLYLDEPVEYSEESEEASLEELNPEDFTLRRKRWPH